MPQAQAYDPTNQNPYQAYEAPQPTPVAPPPAYTQEEGFKFNGAPNSTLGNIAGGLDHIFRGYMRGKFEGDVKKTMQLKAKTDNLQNSYNQDAKLLYDMAASGQDPNSDAYKQAVSAVQGSWGALQDWVGQHVEGEDTKKGKKSKSAQKAASDPLADLKSDDPNVRAQALYAMQKKMGPPVLWQVKQFQTPQAQNVRKATELGTQNALTREQAQATYDKYAGWTEEDFNKLGPEAGAKAKQDYNNAYRQLYPPRQTGATRLYRSPGGDEQNWYLPGEEPEGWNAVQSGSTKLYKSPNGKDQNWFVPGNEPEGWTASTTAGGPKDGSFGAFLIKQFGDHPSGSDYLKARRMWAAAGHIAGSGRGGAEASDKNYQKWMAYYKEHYPGMDEAERDTLARRKVEGSSQLQAGQVEYDASTQPQQFDSDVIGMAVDNLRRMPQYSGNGAKVMYLDDALSNLIGIGDGGYQYHQRGYLQEHGPDSHGKYAGDVTEDQLKDIDRDLQNQIRIILSKQTGMPPDQKRSAAQRMAPIFGPTAPAYGPHPAVPGSGHPPASPPASAAPPAAAHSSAPSSGGQHQPSKGTVKKSAFMKANPGATDADWKGIEPQLKQQGYDTKDD